MRSYWTKVDPTPVTGVLIRRGKFGHEYTGKMPCDHRGRDWGDTFVSQGIPRILSIHQKLGKGEK